MKPNIRSHLLWMLPILHLIITFLFGYNSAIHEMNTIGDDLLSYITFLILAVWLFIGFNYYSKKSLILMLCITICILIATLCFLQVPVFITLEFNATALTSTIYIHFILTWMITLPFGVVCILLRNKLSILSKKIYIILTSFLTILPIIFFICVFIYSRQISNQDPFASLHINIAALFVSMYTVLIVCSLFWGAITLKQPKSEFVAITGAIQFFIVLIAYIFRTDVSHFDMLLYMAFFIFIITMMHQLIPYHKKPSTFLDESSL